MKTSVLFLAPAVAILSAHAVIPVSAVDTLADDPNLRITVGPLGLKVQTSQFSLTPVEIQTGSGMLSRSVFFVPKNSETLATVAAAAQLPLSEADDYLRAHLSLAGDRIFEASLRSLSTVNSLQYGGGPGRALSFNYSVTNGFGINGSYSSIHNRPGGPSKGYDLLGIQNFGQATSYGLLATNSFLQSGTLLLAGSGTVTLHNSGLGSGGVVNGDTINAVFGSTLVLGTAAASGNTAINSYIVLTNNLSGFSSVSGSLAGSLGSGAILVGSSNRLAGGLITSNATLTLTGGTLLTNGGQLVLTSTGGILTLRGLGFSSPQVTTTNNSIYVTWMAPTNFSPLAVLNISPTFFSNVVQSAVDMVFVNGVLTTNYSFTSNGLLQLPGADFLAVGTNAPTPMPRPAGMSPDDPTSGRSLVDDSLVGVTADMDKLVMRPVTAVPEPGTFPLFLLASGAAVVAMRRRR